MSAEGSPGEPARPLPWLYRRQRQAYRRRGQAGSRRGSSAVFLCVILSALVSLCFAFIYSTLEYTTASRGDALMRLSGDSLLSEFDRDVLEEYGLLLLRGNDRELSGKLRGYLLYTFGQEEKVAVTDVKASGAAYALSDPAAARQQILEYMKAGGALKLRSGVVDSPNSAGPSGSPAASDSAGASGAPGGNGASGGAGSAGASGASGSESSEQHGPRISDTDAGRALRHGPTITSLPSRQLPKADLLSRAQAAGELLSDPGSVFADGTDRYLLSSYVLGMFNSTTDTVKDDHFFFREVEYILQGELTDRENRRKTASALKMLRITSNFAHIYADPKKQEALAAAAEILTPGPAAALTQAALATAWAYAESANDAELLMKGDRVPLVKDASSWAIDLENAIEDMTDSAAGGDGVIRPKENKGLNYEQYLRILLFLEDEDLITARVLDLIQINMRKNRDGDFLIGECCAGLTFRADINKRSYAYEKLYQRILYR